MNAVRMPGRAPYPHPMVGIAGGDCGADQAIAGRHSQAAQAAQSQCQAAARNDLMPSRLPDLDRILGRLEMLHHKLTAGHSSMASMLDRALGDPNDTALDRALGNPNDMPGAQAAACGSEVGMPSGRVPQIDHYLDALDRQAARVFALAERAAGLA